MQTGPDNAQADVAERLRDTLPALERNHMTEPFARQTLQSPVHEYMRTDFIQLLPDLTVAQALESILEKQPAGRIIYFYVADRDGRLLGVVPTRRLLMTPRDKQLSQIMVAPVIAIPQSATILDACEFFIFHKLLAFPVVDEERRIVGLVDVELYTRELRDMDQQVSYDDLFQLIGVYASEAQQRSVPALFRRRFPWLLATLAGGLLAAVISDHYYDIASLSLVVPFMPLVLALASSITAQSVSLALQTLHGHSATWAALLAKIKLELATGSMLGMACGSIVAMVVLFWKSNLMAALSLLGAIVGSAACAAGLGLALPYLFRLLRRNPQVAAGPIALASADSVTLLVYLNLGRWLLA
jgi:magnesium transporter